MASHADHDAIYRIWSLHVGEMQKSVEGHHGHSCSFSHTLDVDLLKLGAVSIWGGVLEKFCNFRERVENSFAWFTSKMD